MRVDTGTVVGLTPAVDPRKSDKTFVISGRNFVMDSQGPKSAFGSQMLTPFPVGPAEHTQGVKLKLDSGDRVFLQFPKVLAEWSEVDGNWQVIQETADVTIQPWRLSCGYLNGYVFFCHPALGVYAYDVIRGYCRKLDVDGLPSNPLGLIVNNGRVCIYDDKYFYWSAASDGLDYTPRLGGAGMQKIGDRVSGAPLGLTGYPGGVFVWTTGGVMRCEFTADAAVWRFRTVNTEYRPVNSFCTLQLDANSMVILDERGLFVSKGDVPTPLTPVFNEFLIQYFRDNKLKFEDNCRLEFDELSRRIYLSISLTRYSAVYERAFVLYPAVDSWGSMDEPHFGVFPVLINQSQREGDYYGYVGVDQQVRFWREIGGREIQPTSLTLDARSPSIARPLIQQPSEPNITVFSSWFDLETINPVTRNRAGFYPRNGTTIEALPREGLDSYVRLGLIRAIDQAKMDQLIEVNEVFVGSAKSGQEVISTEDFNLIPEGISDEDYNLGVGGEDYGFGSSMYINHGLKVIGTVDGRSEWTQEEPKLVRFAEDGRYYSCLVTGLWSIVEVSARTLGYFYHIRALELNGLDGGKLN